MTLKLWDIDNGKATYLKHTNSKNESRLVKLKDPMDCDKIPLSDLDNAIELMTEYISSIKKLDDSAVVEVRPEEKGEIFPEEKVEIVPEEKVEIVPEEKIETVPEEKIEAESEISIDPWVKVSARPEVSIRPWIKASKQEKKVEAEPYKKVEAEKEEKVEAEKEEKVEDKQEEKVEAKQEEKVEAKQEEKVEKCAWEDEHDIEGAEKEVPQEVSDKLNLLLKEDDGRRGGAQFLINKNAKKGVTADKRFLSLPTNKNEEKDIDVDKSSFIPTRGSGDISIILKGNVVTRNRRKGKKRKKCSKYEMGIIKCIPEILEDITKSSDNKVLIDVSAFAEKMGKEFVNVKPDTLYVGIKYLLFDYNIIVKMLTSKEADIDTNKSTKIFRLRIKDEHDKLPYSILKQRNEIDE